MSLSTGECLSIVNDANQTDTITEVYKCKKCLEHYYTIVDFIVHKISVCEDEDVDFRDPNYCIKEYLLNGRKEGEVFVKAVNASQDLSALWKGVDKYLDRHLEATRSQVEKKRRERNLKKENCELPKATSVNVLFDDETPNKDVNESALPQPKSSRRRKRRNPKKVDIENSFGSI